MKKLLLVSLLIHFSMIYAINVDIRYLMGNTVYDYSLPLGEKNSNEEIMTFYNQLPVLFHLSFINYEKIFVIDNRNEHQYDFYEYDLQTKNRIDFYSLSDEESYIVRAYCNDEDKINSTRRKNKRCL